MSMYAMTKGRALQAGMRSPVLIAILNHLKTAGESTPVEILAVLLEQGLVTAHELEVHRYWLSSRLNQLQNTHRVARRTSEAGHLVWFALSDEDREALEKAHQAEIVERDCQPSLCRVALPRHVNVMHGPVYSPPPNAPARAGALDHMRAHSVIGSLRVPFRSVS